MYYLAIATYVIIAAIIGTFITILRVKGQISFRNYAIALSNKPSVQTEEFLTQIREVIVHQILNEHIQLFSAIAKQRTILANQGREAVAIFLNPEMFKTLLYNAFTEKNAEYVEELYAILQDLDVPIGYLGDIPVYVSVLLTNAAVFVAGGIEWSLE